VENNRSLDTTYFSSSSIIDVCGGRSEPMSFAAGPVLATGSQIEIESQVSQPLAIGSQTEIESQASQPRMNSHDREPVNTTNLLVILPVS
jgi:hypothetical protein